MCGKSNPADLEICQYCQARLKPLHINPPGGGVPTDSTGLDSQMGDEQNNQQSLDEWLSFLRESGEVSSSRGDNDESVPDWLQEGQESEEIPEISLPSGEEPSDWLLGLREESDDIVQGAAEASEQPEEDLLASSEMMAGEDIPDWLKEISASTPSGEMSLPGVEPAASAEEEAEWLQKIRARQKEEKEEEVSLVQPFVSEDELAAGFAFEDTSGPGVEPVSGDVPSWLEELRGQDVSEVEPPVEPPGLSAPLESEAAQLEAERGELQAPPPESEEKPEEPPPSEELPAAPEISQEEEIPEWMAGVVGGAAGAAVESSAEADLDRLPEWLADLEKSSALDREAIIPFGEEEPELTFDWLQAQIRGGEEVLQAGAAPAESLEIETESGRVSPFVGDLSEFLEDAESSATEAGMKPTEKSEADLAPAELPAWLEAMRPLGAVDVDEGEAVVETSGPLAGLRGVLPAEPEFARLIKPVAYALRLQVSESQQAHANLFEELVQAEGNPKPIPARPAVTSQYLFRVIIFVILAALISWTVFTASRTRPLPTVSGDTFEVSRVVDSLPDTPLVLLAVDYEPALAGEMLATSASVVDHLMLKGAYFVLVSTSPNGPALGEHLIADIASRSGHVYSGINQYANLGFIPGGPTGLAAFVKTPQKILPYALDPETTPVWSRAPLQSVQGLSDFDLVAVATDDPERARYWIEQVGVALDSTPLLMLVSAQAEPMVRPYYQASPRQVQGIVAGLAGGGAYERAHPNLAGGDGLARSYWDAYSYSLLAAALIIVVGAVYNLGMNLSAAYKQAEAGKKP